jgi:signal transduction histidine kinase
VTCDISSLPAHLSMLLKSCLYRFTQEALNNAYRHAGGRGQSVQGSYKDGVVEIAVSDTGPGFEVDGAAFNGKRLGLTGMRDRVVSLGGSFDLASQPGTGTRVTARFEVDHNVK